MSPCLSSGRLGRKDHIPRDSISGGTQPSGPEDPGSGTPREEADWSKLLRQHLEPEATAPGAQPAPPAALLVPIQCRGGTVTFLRGTRGRHSLGNTLCVSRRAHWPFSFPLTQRDGCTHPGLQRDRQTHPRPTAQEPERSRRLASWVPWPRYQRAPCEFGCIRGTKEWPERPPSLLSSNLRFSLSQTQL